VFLAAGGVVVDATDLEVFAVNLQMNVFVIFA
jgi:hypothetical protein